jgi:hypothetical protein
MGKALPQNQASLGVDLSRRSTLMIGLGLALPALPALAALPSGIPESGKLTFRVLRKGSHIGEHTVHFDVDGESLVVRTEVRISVKVGPVPVYKYSQTCVERWSGRTLNSVDVSTASNVSHETVTARRAADGMHIDTSQGLSFVAPADIQPMTHWNRFAHQAPSFNPQDGKVLKQTLVSRQADMAKLADGSTVSATRWTVTGDGVMDDYYDAAGVWTGLHAKVQDGSYVDYLRL